MGVDIAVFMLGKLDVIISNSQKCDLRPLCVHTGTISSRLGGSRGDIEDGEERVR